MSVLNLKQLTGLSLVDIVPTEPGVGGVRLDQKGSFDEYMRQAKTTAVGADNDTFYPANDVGQLLALHAESAATREDDAPGDEQPRDAELDDSSNQDCQLSNEDNITYTEPADNAESSETVGEHPENKQPPLESSHDVSHTEGEEKHQKKDKEDANDPAGISENQANQPLGLVNHDAVQLENCVVPKEDASVTAAEIKDLTSQLPIVTEDAKSVADPGTLNTETSLTAASLAACAMEEAQASVSASAKGQASKKITLENGKNASILLAEKQDNNAVSVPGEGIATTENGSEEVSTRPQRGSQRSRHQNERKEAVANEISKVTASAQSCKEAVANGSPASFARQAEVDVQTLTKSARAKEAIQTANSVFNDKGEVSTNTPMRHGSTAAKTASAISPSKGEDSGLQVDRVRFVQRVERAFAAMGDRGGRVRLKLSPPELGSLRLQITVRKGVMKARVEAETKAAKNLLLENLPALRERLAQQNIKIQQFDVDLRDTSTGGMPQQAGQESETRSGDGGYRAPQSQGQEKSGAAGTTEITRLSNHSGQLNVIV